MIRCSLFLSTWYRHSPYACVVSALVLCKSTKVYFLCCYFRNVVFISWWRVEGSPSQRLKSETGVFKYFKLWVTCISGDIFTATLSLVCEFAFGFFTFNVAMVGLWFLFVAKQVAPVIFTWHLEQQNSSTRSSILMSKTPCIFDWRAYHLWAQEQLPCNFSIWTVSSEAT